MSKILVLTDIHANLPAFDAVMDHADNFDELWFLGDIANFGPNPSECVDKLYQYNPKCIMGNHDKIIASQSNKCNTWDKWSRSKLNEKQLDWIKTYADTGWIDETYFALHGIYNVPYDILPNTSDLDIERAFENQIPPETKNVIFGHYHYEIDRTIKGVNYYCIRPVGHHRDRDIRASYHIIDNGVLEHYRVPYDIEKLIYEIRHKVDCYDSEFIEQWIDLIRNGYSETLLSKDIKQMKDNENKNNKG